MSSASEIVLVVDDDAAVRSALKFALEVEGFAVKLYAGSIALLAEQGLPDRACLVIDYRMPGVDGLELVRRLRARQVALPAILISGRVDDQLRHRAGLAILSVAVFALSAVPLELQRRIVNTIVGHGAFATVVWLALGYAGVALGEQSLKLCLNVYRGWVAESSVRTLRTKIGDYCSLG